jgi:hypothetical protein
MPKKDFSEQAESINAYCGEQDQVQNAAQITRQKQALILG